MVFFSSIGLSVADIDVFEINEAFASQVKYTIILFNYLFRLCSRAQFIALFIVFNYLRYYLL